jgi:SAM-dependent methyltransferase
MNDKAYWDVKFVKAAPPKGTGETDFGKLAETYFPPNSRILDLGAGAGLDSIYFANHGHTVVATDLADTALARMREDIPGNLTDKITVETLDLSKLFPHPDQSFDVVYASVSLHYFDDNTTDQIFSEIHRVLKPNGIVAFILNSKSDAEYGQGAEIEPDYYEVPPHNLRKRFFDVEDIRQRVMLRFNTILLDDLGSRVRSDGITEGKRVRFIGKNAEWKNL